MARDKLTALIHLVELTIERKEGGGELGQSLQDDFTDGLRRAVGYDEKIRWCERCMAVYRGKEAA